MIFNLKMRCVCELKCGLHLSLYHSHQTHLDAARTHTYESLIMLLISVIIHNFMGNYIFHIHKEANEKKNPHAEYKATHAQ